MVCRMTPGSPAGASVGSRQEEQARTLGCGCPTTWLPGSCFFFSLVGGNYLQMTRVDSIRRVGQLIQVVSYKQLCLINENRFKGIPLPQWCYNIHSLLLRYAFLRRRDKRVKAIMIEHKLQPIYASNHNVFVICHMFLGIPISMHASWISL